MEEESASKAPATRLRRRLSVELTDDSKSPQTATPTKKRAGRLAAKPQLELIDENTPQNSPKRTIRKSLVKDVVEQSEDKPSTPLRRTTRVKSNTSIVSETTQNFDSPRAKRAARRNSQVGSDSETAITPAKTRRTRQDSASSIDKPVTESTSSPGRTRRTRKDSAPSLDTQGENETSKPTIITEVISEEPENNNNDTSNIERDEDGSPSNTRKSPRLAKKEKRRYSEKHDDKNTSLEQEKKNTPPSQITHTDKANKVIIESVDKSKHNNEKSMDVPNISIYTSNLLQKVSTDSKKKTVDKRNKSASDNELSKKRHRTKSCNLNTSLPIEGNFYSDNESAKKKIKNVKLKIVISPPNNKIKKDDDSSAIDSYKNVKVSNTSIELNTSSNKSTNIGDTSNESNKENILDSDKINQAIGPDLFFKTIPSNELQPMLFIEDSDSNTDSVGKTGNNAGPNMEDQCVPIVDHQLKEQVDKVDSSLAEAEVSNVFNKIDNKAPNNNTCEPMDIDETMPDSSNVPNLTSDKGFQNTSSYIPQDVDNENESEKGVNRSTRKSISQNHNSEKQNEHNIGSTSGKQSHTTSLSIVEEEENVAGKSVNKSNRKSLLSTSILHDLDKSDTVNRSTLILSHIKDISTTDHNLSKSMQESNTEILSKSLNMSDMHKGQIKKNISLNCLTSTPVHQKGKNEIDINVNTSAIKQNNDEPKKKFSITSTHSDSGSCEENESNASNEKEPENEEDAKEQASSDEADSNVSNNLLDVEAEEADDYESGDSQDEDERKYHRENEIIERGETLTSEDEISNDSDYEKDSFIVSSDEEDDNLLSGSGDDLDMSDKELTMNSKSKKKYNERSVKLQKRASREMFEARHNISDSQTKTKTKKSNRQRLDSTLLKSGDDVTLPPKKNKRMRLESSTLESNASKSDIDEAISKEKNMSDTHENMIKTKRTNQTSKSQSNSHDTELFSENKYSDIDERGDQISQEIKHKTEQAKIIIAEEDLGSSGYIEKKAKKKVNKNNGFDESEISTVLQESILEKDDPLIINVKKEPKTPLKNLDISTVNFTHREEVEEVCIDRNVSIEKSNDTLDPLALQDQCSDDEKSISENEEISKNFESVLEELNKKNKPIKTKLTDISLNLGKKPKQKVKEVIIDQLNITQIKEKSKLKKKLNNSKNEEAKQKVKSVEKKIIKNSDDDNSSDAIDFKLLFSEESNDSERGEQTRQESNDSICRLTGNEIDEIENIQESNHVTEDNEYFFIDTTGSPLDVDSSTKQSSSKKNKKNRSSLKDALSDSEENYIETPADTSLLSGKNKKTIEVPAHNADRENMNLTKTPGSEKKKKKLTLPKDDIETLPEAALESGKKKKTVEVTAHNADKNYTDLSKTPGSEKKKKFTRPESAEKIIGSNEVMTSGKKHKKSSSHITEENVVEEIGDGETNVVGAARKKRKRKSSKQGNDEDVCEDQTSKLLNESQRSSRKKKQKLSQSIIDVVSEDIEATENQSKYKNKKRKERDDEDVDKPSKVPKENFSDRIHVPRLPADVLNQLDDKPKKQLLNMKKESIVSTTEFKVEEARRRKNKPSIFLEESVYLNSDSESPEKSRKVNLKKPKVLPFIPTASTSGSGFTTNFQVKILPQKIEFVAKKDMSSFKTDYLLNKRKQKLRTHELYKKHRSVKLSKY